MQQLRSRGGDAKPLASVAPPLLVGHGVTLPHVGEFSKPIIGENRRTDDSLSGSGRWSITAVKRFLAAIRPENGPKPYEVRFETPPGVQAQVDKPRVRSSC
jgi:hypothetical protein